MKSRKYAPFPQTHWSLVHRAGVPDKEARQRALETLLQRYEPALRSYLRVVRRLPYAAVDDLLQAFFADKLLHQTFLGYADAGRGRFRTFLLTSLNRYVVSSGRRLKVRLTVPLLEENAKTDPAAADPAAIVEANWARVLIMNVVESLRGECLKINRPDIWAVFEARILGDIFELRQLVPYETLAKDLSLKSPTQAANLLITAKRMYARLLRKAVGEYERESDISDEIMELQAILHRGQSAR